MNKLVTFVSSHSYCKREIYQDINDKVNKYAEENNLNIENVSYECLDDSVIANVLFSEAVTEEQEDSLIQSYRDERQLLFDSFNKQTKTACNIIESLINCIDRDKYKDIVSNAEEYLIIHNYGRNIMNNTRDEE